MKIIVYKLNEINKVAFIIFQKKETKQLWADKNYKIEINVACRSIWKNERTTRVQGLP